MESEDASMDLWWFLIEMTSHNHDISSNGQYQYINYFFSNSHWKCISPPNGRVCIFLNPTCVIS